MKNMHSWPVAVAKAEFSHLLEQAQSDGPQMVTRNGRPAVVIVSVKEWEAKAKRSQKLSEFLIGSPLGGSDLEAPRLRGKWRKAKL